MYKFIIILTALLLAGCGPVKTPLINNYAIHTSSRLTLAKRPTDNTIVVAVPKATSELQSSEMLYTIKPYELKAFAKHEWVAQPAQMLQPLLVQSLKNTRYFKAVVSAPSSVETNYRVATKLLALKQDFIAKPSRIVMSLSVDLINEKTDRIIASRLFTTTVQTQSDTPYAGVVAANAAARRLLQQTVKFVVASARHSR